MRAGRSSRVVSATAVLGLIVVSVLMLYLIDASNLLNPTSPTSAAPAAPAPSHSQPGHQLNGSLVILVTSNQNATGRLALPTNTLTPAKGVPVVATFLDAVQGAQAEYPWTTNANGLTGCVECLPVGLYVVSIHYDGLELTIPSNVFVGEQTLVRVSFTGRSYDLTYCAESGVLVTPSAAQYTMFASVNSSVAVPSVSQPVYLNVMEDASAVAGYSVNATVLSQGAPTMGTQWLQLGTLSPVDLVNATSISMTAWTSSTTTTVGPVTYLQGVLEP